MRAIRLLAALMAAGALSLWPSIALAAPNLTISPGSGIYAATQGMDLVILVDGASGLGVIGGQVLLDDNDITALAVTVFHYEAVAGGFAFRSVHLPMGILGLGTHTFRVTLVLTDGSQVSGAAVWQVLTSN